MAEEKSNIDTNAIMRSLGIAEPEAEAPRDLNEVMHGLLIIGLYVSVVFMVLGIGIDLIRSRILPTEVLSLSEAFSRTISLRASGYFSMGLLVLILTPLLRVIGSVVIFALERDWRYTGVTLIVMVVMIISITVGQG